MKKLLVPLALFLVVGQPARAQNEFESRVLTHPKLPPREYLDRLDLNLAWAVKVPMATDRDGIDSFQILPSKDGDEVLVQTRAGLVQLMNAETGDLKWRSPVGPGFTVQQAAAYNPHSIFVVRENILYVLDRKTGRHRVFSIDRIGFPVLGFPLPYVPTATPVADDVAVFLAAGRRVFTFTMPEFDESQLTLPPIDPASALPQGKRVASLQPVFHRNVLLPGVVISRPLILAGERLAALGDEGTFVSLNKFTSQIMFEFKTYDTVSAGMGQYDELVYIPSDDNTVYALHTLTGQLHWRFLAGAPVTRTPQVTYKDVFISATRKGLSRVDRLTGRAIWHNPEADKFLAVNEKFVYATDRRNCLMILDYALGRTLTLFDVPDFVIPISNTLTDRIYLANHDGSIVCLHYRDNRTPYRPSMGPEKEEAPKQEAPKQEAPKNDKKAPENAGAGG
jgi:outer membrane protein assembly factor BamB